MSPKVLLNRLSFLLYFTGLVHLLIQIRRRVFRRYGVYILSYHHVIERCDSDRLGHDVTVKHFEDQLNFATGAKNVLNLNNDRVFCWSNRRNFGCHKGF